MHIEEIAKLAEAAKQTCPNCGKSIANNHYWYKGERRCKQSAQTPGGTMAQTPGIAPTQGSLAPDQSGSMQPNAQPNVQPTLQTSPGPRKMKTPIGPDLKTQITDWLTKFDVKGFIVNDDYTVNVNQDVNLDGMRWPKFPVKFGKVDGDFVSSGGVLKTAENMPQEITGDFIVNHNSISSAVGGPKKVGGDMVFSTNPIDSVAGFPAEIGGSLTCDSCPNLKSLHNIHEYIREIGMNQPEGAGGEIDFKDCPIEANIMGLLMIKGLTKVQFTDPKMSEIINKHLEDRNTFECAEKLYDTFPHFPNLPEY